MQLFLLIFSQNIHLLKSSLIQHVSFLAVLIHAMPTFLVAKSIRGIVHKEMQLFWS